MEDPDQLQQRHQELLHPSLLSGLQPPEAAFLAWKRYVADEINKMLRAGVAPRYNNSWMLRKAVRTLQPYSTLKRLYDTTLEPPEWFANNYEAFRYALLDRTLSVEVRQLFARFALPSRRTLSANFLTIAFAVMAADWDLALQLFEEVYLHMFGDAQENILLLFHSLGLPEDKRPQWFSTALNQIPDLAHEAIKKRLRDVLTQEISKTDDADNYLSLDCYSLSADGITVTYSQIADSDKMSAWLTDSDKPRENYVDKLGVVLASHFRNFNVIGSGAFGVVLSATRNNKRYAIKLTRLVGPLRDASDQECSIAERELEVNLALASSMLMRDTLSYFPYVDDWTRGRLDLHATLDNIVGTRSAISGLILRGAAIYLVQVMPAFDYTLEAWIRAVPLAVGDKRQAYALFVDMFVAMFAVLLVQLAVMRTALPGFQHTDIKPNNVLLLRVARGNTEASNRVVSVSIGQLAEKTKVRGTVAVSLSQTGGYAPSLSDFGLAGVPSGSKPLGTLNRTNNDAQRMRDMIPDNWPDPQKKLEKLRRLLSASKDSGSQDFFLTVFAETGPLSAFLSK